ncbi:MAG: glycosyltransferase [Flavobacteriales bacterium]
MISIVICTLNEEYYLPKLLDSIRIQKDYQYEVVISDTGSEDSTAEVAHRYKSEFGMPINFIACNNLRNISLQRNIGANHAIYEHLLFLDADVVLPDENFLKTAMKEVISEGIKVGGCKIYATESNLYYRFLYWMYSNIYLTTLRWFKPAVHGCCIFSTKEIYYKIGGFNNNIIFEDYRYDEDAAIYYRSKLLKSTFVKTSARRFYKATFRSTVELLLAGIYSFFRTGIKGEYMKGYFRLTGKHSKPQY